MTVTFVPGEVSKSPYSVSQASWKSHHIIAYGSGNNLILSTISDAPVQSYTNIHVDLDSYNKHKHLQTIYLDADPTAIHIHPSNGLIAVSISHKLHIFKPVNEYMAKPQWQEACVITNDNDPSPIRSLQWAQDEDELVVGSDHSLSLYHVYDEYGSILHKQRFFKPQPSPVHDVRITNDASKILSFNVSRFDNLVKIWLRINFDDDSSLFDLAYLKHPNGSWVTQAKWRLNNPAAAAANNQVVDGSMANIKNIRSYIGDGDGDHEILYTLTNDHVLRVWATFEFSGHNHIKCWSQLDLKQESDFGKDGIAGVIILDSGHLESVVIPHKDSQQQPGLEYIMGDQEFDILLVVSYTGAVNVFAVSNLGGNPPNSIKFTKLPNLNFELKEECFPSSITLPEIGDLSKLSSQSEPVQIFLNPLIFPEITTFHQNYISLLIHDRLKNTIRTNILSFKEKSYGQNEKHLEINTKLINKFQGHTKSIRKLVTSSSYSKSNILLSISDFPQHNYIWEPLLLNPDKEQNMTITKRFKLDVSHELNQDTESGRNQGIYDAILINDIRPRQKKNRHHLAVVAEKDGYLSVWNCNGVKGDDQPAVLLQRVEVCNEFKDRISQKPKALLLIKSRKDEYCVISIFAHDLIKAWKFTVKDEDEDISVKLEDIGKNVEKLPNTSVIHQISTIDSFTSNNLLSIIDDVGNLQILSTHFDDARVHWKEVTRINTSIPNASKIHGSSIIDRFAIVDETGSKLTIWDTRAGNLEYEEDLPSENGAVKDLDWSFVESSFDSSTNAVLSVGFSRFVLLYTQLRYDYTNNIPAFAVLKKIDISDYTSHEIGDSIWIDNGYLVIGCGNQFFIDDKWVRLGSSNNKSLDYTIKQLVVGYKDNHDSHSGGHKKGKVDDSMFEISHLVRILNGPLPIYHPQFIIQALFMNQFKLVQDILVILFGHLREDKAIQWDLGMNIEKEMFVSKKDKFQSLIHPTLVDYGSDHTLDDIFKKFTPTLVKLLVEKLTKVSLPLLTRHQQITLISVITIVDHLSQNSSLDENGIRFMIGFKLFQLSSKQPTLTMRDINWALHSESRELLYRAVEDHCNNRLSWDITKKVGLMYWISARETLIEIVEKCARNDFSENRDPSGIITLFFLSIRKKQILLGLWKTTSHPEKQKMLKFLSNNFNEPRWKSAALKNAFVLLGKHRYLDAACFFLLGDKVKDCCATLANKIGDVELSLMVAKVYDTSKESLTYIIENYVLPKALHRGDKWVTSWVFWELNHQELSVQALIKSPASIVNSNQDCFSDLFFKNHLAKLKLASSSKLYLHDDPVLMILFDNLRKKKIKYFKGSLAIDKRTEFEFILKIASIYTRMGCDYLALSLIKDWEFIDHAEKKTIYHTSKTTEGLNGNANGSNDDNNDIFKEFKPALAPPQPTTFEEPDIMSAFDF